MTEKMTAVTLSGPVAMLDEALERFVLGRDLHPENAVRFLSSFRRLSPFLEPDPYEPRLAELRTLMQELGVAPARADFAGRDFTPEGVDDYTRALQEKLSAMEDEIASLSTEDSGEREAEEILSHLRPMPVRMDSLADARYVHLHFGRIPLDRWEKCLADVEKRPDELLAALDKNAAWMWCLAASLPEGSDQLDATLSGYGFERIMPNPRYCVDKTAAQILEELARERARQEARIEELQALIAAQKESSVPELLARFSWLKYKSTCFGLRALAGRSHNRFYLAGWVPAERAPALEREFEAVPGFTCTLINGLKLPAEPPVRMREGKLSSVAAPLLKMYGMPAYGDSDPRVFLLLSYILFFGIMFGDAGQGAVLAILGFALYAKTKNWLCRIFGLCGCSSILFGLVYGSVFGFEELLPWGGFHPLENENIMTVLLLAVAVGVVILVVCMGFNIINALRRRDWKSGLFSPNGVCGLVFYLFVMAAVVGAYTGAFSLLRGPALWLGILLPLILMWLSEPLTKLLEGRKDAFAGLGMVLVESFFDLFEAMLSYLSNTMSFLRLGAFAISHAGMMMVVFLLTENAAATGRVIIIVLGNIFVAGLEAALASIQIIRLEYYEMFGRYNAGRGRVFDPVTVEYK